MNLTPFEEHAQCLLHSVAKLDQLFNHELKGDVQYMREELKKESPSCDVPSLDAAEALVHDVYAQANVLSGPRPRLI